VTKIASFLLTACTIFAQVPSTGPEFEVASIRPAQPNSPQQIQRQGITIEGGRVNLVGVRLVGLIPLAFRVPQNQVKGPDSMATESYDIVAKLPAGASEDQVPEMLQALLKERFKLEFHRENKEQSAYALVVAKGGLKVAESAPEANAPAPAAERDPNSPPPPTMLVPLGGGPVRVVGDSKGATVTGPRLGTVQAKEDPNGLRLEAPNITFDGLASILTQLVRAPVVDMTGLKGRYQVVLAMSRNEMSSAPPPPGPGGPVPDASDPTGSPIFAAVQKLGLKLESRKISLETIVVDHLEKTPTEN